MIEASCHCGAVTIGLDAVPGWLNECQCSICRRYGVQWAYYRRASARVRAGALDTYEWGRRSLAFHRCAACGVVTHWTSNDPERDEIAVNARLLDPIVVAGLPVRRSPGPPA